VRVSTRTLNLLVVGVVNRGERGEEVARRAKREEEEQDCGKRSYTEGGRHTIERRKVKKSLRKNTQ
jgi:hypothetical protein